MINANKKPKKWEIAANMRSSDVGVAIGSIILPPFGNPFVFHLSEEING